MPDVALELPEPSVPFPTATSPTCVDYIAEKVVGDIADAAQEELDTSETPSPSLATVGEASEAVEQELTPPPTDGTEAVVLASGSDQEVVAAEVSAVELEQEENHSDLHGISELCAGAVKEPGMAPMGLDDKYPVEVLDLELHCHKTFWTPTDQLPKVAVAAAALLLQALSL
jgi:hypothetical protein